MINPSQESEVIEGEVQDTPDENGPQLSLGIKNSVITQQPVGIIIKVGDLEHVTNVANASTIAIKLLEIAAYITIMGQLQQQQLAQRVMDDPMLGKKITDANGRPIVL